MFFTGQTVDTTSLNVEVTVQASVSAPIKVDVAVQAVAPAEKSLVIPNQTRPAVRPVATRQHLHT